jgi:hypothetical protein
MKNNLIICPVGMPMVTDNRYDMENHWRFTKDFRKYETLAVVYNDFEPEPNSYDHIIRMKGHKWQLIREVSKIFDYKRYNYIGCVDDDLVTDIHSFNKGLELAEKHDFRYWQLSMPHDSDLHPNYHDCLRQKPDCTYTETNFIEMGSCFFRKDKFEKVLELLSLWDCQIAWGVDKIFYDFLQDTANVVHSATILQPHRQSYYDHNFAMQEMNDFLYNKYPNIMRKHYNREPNWVDRQVTLKLFNDKE